MTQVVNCKITPTLTVLKGGKESIDSNDVELVLACQRKETKSFDKLIRRHQCTVERMFRKLAPDWKGDLSDLTQEVFIRVWSNIDQLRNPAAFKGWLNKIVTNIFYDELRKRPHFHIVSLDEPITNESNEQSTRDVPDNNSSPDDYAIREELTEKIGKAISKLPVEFQTAVALRDVDGLSYDEIACLTSTQIGTVKSRISRGRIKIQNILSAYLEQTA